MQRNQVHGRMEEAYSLRKLYLKDPENGGESAKGGRDSAGRGIGKLQIHTCTYQGLQRPLQRFNLEIANIHKYTRARTMAWSDVCKGSILRSRSASILTLYTRSATHAVHLHLARSLLVTEEKGYEYITHVD